jgi:hypothetical protein
MAGTYRVSRTVIVGSIGRGLNRRRQDRKEGLTFVTDALLLACFLEDFHAEAAEERRVKNNLSPKLCVTPRPPREITLSRRSEICCLVAASPPCTADMQLRAISRGIRNSDRVNLMTCDFYADTPTPRYADTMPLWLRLCRAVTFCLKILF